MAIKDKWDQIFGHRVQLVDRADALPGRDQPSFEISGRHAVLGTDITPPFPDTLEVASFALGCFWGAERRFWQQPGVWTTAAGYAGGLTPNPTYEEVCSGLTGHAEVVLVVYDPQQIDYEALLRLFWEAHDPTQGMRQGNDIGTQYRSVIHCHGQDQLDAALASRELFAQALARAGYGPISTEILDAPPFHYAEAEHQQYLDRYPHGYCGLRGTGVCLP